MSGDEKNVPKRRFKEFEDTKAWIRSKIGKTGYFYYGKSAPKWSVTIDAKTPCVRYGELYTKHSEIIDKIYSYTNIPRDNLKFSTGKEVLVPRVGEDPLDFANCSWLSISDVAIGEMISVYNTEHNPLFTSYMFNALYKYEFAKRVEGGNVSNLYYAYLEDIPVSFPSIDEQEKIATFLKYISNLITIHQRKLEKMKALKKAYLMEMFPVEGELNPKLRFVGFTNDWGQSKLGEVSKLSSSKRVHREDYAEKGIPFFRGLEISKLGSYSKLEDLLYISKEYYNNLKDKYGVPKIGDILITAVGTLGNSYLICDNTPFYFKDGNLIWFSDIKINPQYLNIYIGDGIGKKRVLESATGSNQKALTMVKLQDIQVLIPSKEEQRKIGIFFQNLDNLIIINQHKLDKLQNIKKAYLNEMFI
ncbi:restriction endonuclease subunit S [Vallitalea sp.]|jgi:type I restriction enzyme S subunit|uniref:restriction endonuclease subunit S n=1 Tax=Vallitalea sp. TaxID=1882829 RepID=UPI0025E666A4|nr:restriction endonuclease subunit S [Vallitalea sp.]MCT4686454.1 restriction endonuclease subunit S [Vallitalea sp.]